MDRKEIFIVLFLFFAIMTLGERMNMFATITGSDFYDGFEQSDISTYWSSPWTRTSGATLAYAGNWYARGLSKTPMTLKDSLDMSAKGGVTVSAAMHITSYFLAGEKSCLEYSLDGTAWSEIGCLYGGSGTAWTIISGATPESSTYRIRFANYVGTTTNKYAYIDEVRIEGISRSEPPTPVAEQMFSWFANLFTSLWASIKAILGW